MSGWLIGQLLAIVIHPRVGVFCNKLVSLFELATLPNCNSNHFDNASLCICNIISGILLLEHLSETYGYITCR